MHTTNCHFQNFNAVISHLSFVNLEKYEVTCEKNEMYQPHALNKRYPLRKKFYHHHMQSKGSSDQS